VGGAVIRVRVFSNLYPPFFAQIMPSFAKHSPTAHQDAKSGSERQPCGHGLVDVAPSPNRRTNCRRGGQQMRGGVKLGRADATRLACHLRLGASACMLNHRQISKSAALTQAKKRRRGGDELCLHHLFWRKLLGTSFRDQRAHCRLRGRTAQGKSSGRKSGR